MKLHRIDPDPSPIVREACQQMEVAEQTVQATLELYKRKGFIPPWTGYLAEDRSKGSGLLVCLLGETNPRAAAWADGGVQFEAAGNRLDPSGVTQWLASLGRYPDC